MPAKAPTFKPRRIAAPVHQAPEQQRATSAKRGYGYRWQQTRKGWLMRHPLCVECLAQGRTEPATDVDHIVPHRGDQALFWDRDNWQSLCKSHHSAKTAREDGGFGNQKGEN